ncbi:taste receptor type 2 member 110-like [Fukomys damarensis]|uniref:taste receptor type 2 member 110-like n=1 Tax=Fukomys damarensis TaxID=885580 RepID=UPI00053FE8B2|nr:taste receptor type 2 member 110-like [Fukomys damarensis]
MNAVLWSTFAIIFCMEVVIGYLGNGLIALVNFMDWIKRRKICAIDQILSALAISRIGVLCIGLLSVLILVLDSAFFMTIIRFRVMSITWTVTNHFSLWLSTCLSIFYFLKIANFSNPLFLYLAWRIKKVASGTLLVSLFFLFLNVTLVSKYIDAWNDALKKNMSYSSRIRNSVQIFKPLAFMNCVFAFIPFSVSLTNFFLLIFSMWKHLKKLQRNMKGYRDVSTTAHIKALQIGFASILLYTLIFLSLIIEVICLEFLDETLILLYDQASGISFPSSPSFVLILGNRKLRQASLSVLRRLRCRAKGVEYSDP